MSQTRASAVKALSANDRKTRKDKDSEKYEKAFLFIIWAFK
jgi:hypothetical protein